MTFQRLQILQAEVMPGDLSDHVDRVRYERLHPKKKPSRKQLAKLRQMINEMSAEDLRAGAQIIESNGK